MGFQCVPVILGHRLIDIWYKCSFANESISQTFFVVVTDWALPEVCLEAVIFSEKNINVNLVESCQMCKCSTNSNVINPKSNIFLWKWSWKGEFFNQKVCIWWYLVQNMWQCDVKYFHVSWLDVFLWSNWMFCSLAFLSD